jgi:hypothetical protein
MAENSEAWELWLTVQTQWRAGGFGILGLDYGCLMKMAGLLRIGLTPALLKKIQALEASTLKSSRPKVDK